MGAQQVGVAMVHWHAEPVIQPCATSVHMQAAQAEPPHRLLVYEYVPDILDKRGPHREAHLAAAQKLAEAGKCLLGGAAGSPPSQGVFVMHGMSDEVRTTMPAAATALVS